MGKVTGFMEFERVNETYEAPAQRIHHYKEFVLALEDAEAQVQGARCMDCGIPFCNNGCPVNNIIPDFNDLVFHGDWKSAIEVLHSTNNFPEFTGRICPAPCEAACTLTINRTPVGINPLNMPLLIKPGKAAGLNPKRLNIKRANELLLLARVPQEWQQLNS